MEPIDVEKIKTETEADKLIEEHKSTLHRKVKMQASIKDSKKEMSATFREQLKEVAEEIDHEVGVIDALNARKLELSMKV